ncbi:hypothetical protein D9M72_585720 [compost metagenome]
MALPLLQTWRHISEDFKAVKGRSTKQLRELQARPPTCWSISRSLAAPTLSIGPRAAAAPLPKPLPL